MQLDCVARHLLVAVWHVLTHRSADKHADPHRVAFKLMAWSWRLTDDQRAGLTPRQFIRYHLMRLRLGDDLTEVVRGRTKRQVAPLEELLALRPDLRPAH